ncbi:MAG: hypothetical protein F6K10_23780 [Moorea sp. SIO2B7]|uniref:Uncharacterized protein n=1 Tax=Moorena producens (strain JHB) TaxID=1454205 RepID=A0A1D9FVP9_MOOP1|nr:hypothetical protein [Moorena producens]AOY79395.2 hypothetical protein BJP36_05145 [Moorena producens JHB]NES84179.1 hypothetical protein [Moorena sp. SIO2B7]
MSDCIKKGLVLNANQPRPAKLVIPKGQIGELSNGRVNRPWVAPLFKISPESEATAQAVLPIDRTGEISGSEVPNNSSILYSYYL